MSKSSEAFMREAAKKNQEARAKQEERLRRYCDGTRTAQEVANLLGLTAEGVRSAAKRLGLTLGSAR